MNDDKNNNDPLKIQLFGKPTNASTSSLKNQVLGPSKPVHKKPPKIIHNYETLSEPVDELKKDLNKQVGAKDSIKKAWEQLLGADNLFFGKTGGSSGGLEPGQELDLKALQQQQEQKNEEEQKKHNIDPHIKYKDEILHGTERAIQKERQETTRQVQELVVDVRQAGAAAQMDRQAIQATEGSMQDVGISHKRHLQRLLSWLQELKTKLEDGESWVNAVQGKKNMKGKIGAPAKQQSKHQMNIKKMGEKYRQSGERALNSSGN